MPLAVLAFILLLATLAAAADVQLQADKVYDLKLTGADIAALATAANELPFKTAQPLLEKLLKQTAPAPEPPADPKAKPGKK